MSFFTTNPMLIALANVGGAIGLLIVLYKSLLAAYRFLRSWYASSFRSAIKRIEKNHRKLSVNCAADHILFTSFLAMEACRIFVSGVLLILYNSLSISRMPKSELKAASLALHIDLGTLINLMTVRSIIIFCVMTFLMIYIACSASKVFIVSKNVNSLRIKRSNRVIRLRHVEPHR